MRIIGYNDPRKLNELKEWNELKEYHHFCISQTLVQGLSREYGRNEFKVLTTIDKLIKKFYREWSNNPENDVNHFLDIRRYIEMIEDNKLRKAFIENRMEVYNSIRFLLECDITSSELKKEGLSKEKIEFIKIYEKIEKNPNWVEIKELDSKTMYSLKESIKEIIIDEIENETVNKRGNIKDELSTIVDEVGKEFHLLTDESKSEYIDELISTLDKKILKIKNERGKIYKRLRAKLELYKEVLIDFDEKTINKVIFHGVHQFTPIMLKLINYLEKNNIEVIFLINYDENFNRLYSTWDNVYKWTNCKIEKYRVNYKYDSLKIAKNYAAIIEGDFEKLEEYNSVVINKFDNYTEMSNYVSKVYSKARETLKGEFNGTSVLANMTEQFYSVDGTNINDILRVYFPEQFEQKHFLAYPVGQLILAIYNLWDENKNQIIMKEGIIRECLSTNIWTTKNILYSPLEIFEMIKVYFSDLEDHNIDEYISRIDKLKSRINKINSINNNSKKNDYKRFGFYRLNIEEIEFFKNIILEIKYIITALMGDGKETNMINHYKSLLLLLSEKINESNDDSIKKEIKFVQEIKARLDNLDSRRNESIAAIKETLYFYLAQNKCEDTSNWIVRDFNQIDGGVLLADPNAKERNSKDKKPIYHFMEVSDNDMKGKSKINLSWPLDEEFINKDNNKILKIISNCKKEYKNYLRFALFYALFYIGEIDIKISYVENKNDNLKEEVYYILKLLNLKEENKIILEDMNFKDIKKNIKSKITISENLISNLDILNYNFCEERFLYESLIEGEGSFNEEFLINQYLKIFIGINLFKNFNKENLESRIKWIVPYANKTLLNDIEFAAIEKCKYFESYGRIDLDYEYIIKNYIFAKFTEEDIIESLLKYKKSKKTVNQILDYLNGENYIGRKNISDKCLYCKYRSICAGR